MRVLVTGGAGFIGSALVRHLIANSDHEVLNFDKLTYAGTLTSLATVSSSPKYRFKQGDICDERAVAAAIEDFQPDIITPLRQNHTSIARLTGQVRLFRRMLLGHTPFWRKRWSIGADWTAIVANLSAFTIFRRMKFSVLSAKLVTSLKRRRMIRARRTRLLRPDRITWSPPGATRLAFRSLLPIAPTITALIISRKS